MIGIEKAAEQLDISVDRIRDWAALGLLELHTASPSGEKLVDEEQLHDVAESMGWLQVSQESWDSAEE